MKTKLFFFIFLSFAIIGCENKIEQEEEEILDPPSDTTVIVLDSTFSQRAWAVLVYLQSIPTSEIIKDYDYPPFILEEIARYETYSEYERNTSKIKLFAGELDNGERRFLKRYTWSSCWGCMFYNENGDNVSYDNNEESGKSLIDVKNWKLIYEWGNGSLLEIH